MVDPSSFMQYTQGQTSTASMPRSDMPPQFMVGNTYTAITPVTSPQTPQYPPGNHFTFGPYTPPSPPVIPSYKHYQEECQPPCTIPTDTRGIHVGYQQDPYQAHPVESEGRIQIKYESQVDIQQSPSPSPCPLTSKTVARNVPEDRAQEVVFHSEIDTMMKAIQLKSEPNEEFDSGVSSYPSPPHQDEEKFNLRRKPCSPEKRSSTISRGGKDRQKRYVCDFKGCGKRCAQKTQLETHKRAHTGEKPFICEEPGCGLGFSQRGNLKSHIRQHTGEKPYRCDICQKAFAQLGNVKPHRSTHFRTKPFMCLLDGCHKTFSQRGNLKTHHNAYHTETIKRLTRRFKNMANSEELSEEEARMFKHFAELYKNLNKGIKGRGHRSKNKGVRRSQSSVTPGHSQPYASQTPPLAQQGHMYQLRYTASDGLPYAEDYGDCGMSRNGLPSNMVDPRDHHTAYGQYDIDQASISASETTTASRSPSIMHENQYGSAFATHHRGY
ncbi:hypothetical protein F4815DRAFT_187767 [Daldinia loculata]|nr:hypothetical protein F4815DRAFT_187767 [Daldinia loculata]